MPTRLSTQHRSARPLSHAREPDPDLDDAKLVTRWGRSPVSPFLAEPGNRMIRLRVGAVAGYRPVRRWAVFPTDAAAPPGHQHDALCDLLEQVSAARRRPLFAAVVDPEPYRMRGMWPTHVADDAVIDARAFSLAGKRMASIRHSVTSAHKAGLEVVTWSSSAAVGVEQSRRSGRQVRGAANWGSRSA